MSKIQKKSVGIGLRSPHYLHLLEAQPDIGFLEIHSENYFNPHSKNHDYLEQIAQHYPLSFHGIGLSLGSSDPISQQHLKKLKTLVDRFQPALVSDHLSWCSLQGNFFNDLLPIPYTEEALACFTDNVNQVQDFLQRQIIVENPSSYLEYQNSDMSEAQFLNTLTEKTGCGLLLDLNNVYVSAINQQFSVSEYLAAINHQHVQEIHLAGHSKKEVDGETLLIDTHSTQVSDAVWDIYQQYLHTTATDAITLIEWDVDIPALDDLLIEAQKAQHIRQVAK
ncbi:hypothetical protein CW745_03850 [Psychromonas sp. psych-6C06]|uniref:MNIO family bufferin maturase n=1 Tax=Psychromonas sp. psych-6C06 TaxID=2058089 RepID=UPI000C3354BB|nr:DUF692 domain-containing protein [Psychromonas sp. psych-6C06]PKF62565.1 hypothetical protein CW745_03850 [Psychromonas sp. psych-6C06]